MSHTSSTPNNAARPSLDELKKAVQRKYLGQAGLHGVGASERQNAIKLYLTKCDGAEQNRLIAEVRKELASTNVELVFDDAPSVLKLSSDT